MGGAGHAGVPFPNAKGSMELRDYTPILRKSRVLIVLVTLLGAGIAATYSLVVTPEYQAPSKHRGHLGPVRRRNQRPAAGRQLHTAMRRVLHEHGDRAHRLRGAIVPVVAGRPNRLQSKGAPDVLLSVKTRRGKHQNPQPVFARRCRKFALLAVVHNKLEETLGPSGSSVSQPSTQALVRRQGTSTSNLSGYLVAQPAMTSIPGAAVASKPTPTAPPVALANATERFPAVGGMRSGAPSPTRGTKPHASSYGPSTRGAPG